MESEVRTGGKYTAECLVPKAGFDKKTDSRKINKIKRKEG